MRPVLTHSDRYNLEFWWNIKIATPDTREGNSHLAGLIFCHLVHLCKLWSILLSQEVVGILGEKERCWLVAPRNPNHNYASQDDVFNHYSLNCMWSVVFYQGTPKYNQKIKNNPNISDVAVCGKSCCIYIYCFVCRDFLWTKLSSISWRLHGRAKSSAIFGREQFHQVWSIYRQEYPTWSNTFERKFRSSPITDFSRLVKRRDFWILRSPFQGRRVP